MFLAHFTGWDETTILDLTTTDFLQYFKSAEKLYEIEAKRPIEVVLVGIKK